jgi:hypothetical protein
MNWDGALPMTTEEAQKQEFRAVVGPSRLHGAGVSESVSQGKRISHEIDPEGLASISGTVPTPHNGCNWFEIDRVVDYLNLLWRQPGCHAFSISPGVAAHGVHRLWRHRKETHLEQWRRLFYGHTGASIFWHYTLMNRT